MKNKHIFLLILSAFLIRMIPAFFVYGSADVDNFRALSELMKQGKWCLYSYTDHNPYPPLLSWLVYALRMIADHSGLAFSFIMKIPAILADSFICLLIYRICLKFGKDNAQALFWGFVYAFNPVSILISSVHGQFDPLVMFFCLASLYVFYFRKKDLWFCALCLGTGIWLKGFAIILLPLYLINLDSNAKRLRYVFWAFLPVIISFIPYLLVDPAGVYNTVLRYSPRPENWGYHLLVKVMQKHLSWPIFSGIEIFSRAYGNHLLFASLIFFYLFFAPKISLLKAHMLIFTLFYSFTAGFGLQYLSWVLVFAILMRGWFIWVFSALGGLWLFISYLPSISNSLYRFISSLITEDGIWRLAVFFSLLTWVSCMIATIQMMLTRKIAQKNG
jgi:hypothetical protein